MMYRFIVILLFVLGAVCLLGIPKNVYAQEPECPVIFTSDSATVHRNPSTKQLEIIKQGLTVTGSNWWYAWEPPVVVNPKWVEARGITIFNLQDLVIPDGAQVFLNLGDSGGKICDDIDTDCNLGNPSPNVIDIVAFTAEDQDVTIDDWGQEGTSISTVTTRPENAVSGSAVIYSVDVTSAVLKAKSNENRFLGFRFEPTQPSDFEDFRFAYLHLVPTDIDFSGIIKEAFEVEERFPHLIRTKHAEIRLVKHDASDLEDHTGIKARFSPICGTQRLPVATLATALQIDHFNWEQKIIYPSNWHPERWQDVQGGSCDQNSNTDFKTLKYCTVNEVGERVLGENIVRQPEPKPYYDPIVGSEGTKAIGIDGPEVDDCCRWVIVPIDVDNFTPYYDEPDEIKQVTTDAGLNFYDAPRYYPWMLTYDSDSVNQYVHFITELVGVQANGNIIRWPNVGFRWKANTTIDTNGHIIITKPPSGIDIPPAIGGEIFEVEVLDSPTVGIEPNSLNFITQNETDPPDQQLALTSIITDTFNWEADESITWLTLSPISGTVPSTMTASVSATGLDTGVYTGTILITTEIQSLTYPVTLTIRSGIYLPLIIK